MRKSVQKLQRTIKSARRNNQNNEQIFERIQKEFAAVASEMRKAEVLIDKAVEIAPDGMLDNWHGLKAWRDEN